VALGIGVTAGTGVAAGAGIGVAACCAVVRVVRGCADAPAAIAVAAKPSPMMEARIPCFMLDLYRSGRPLQTMLGVFTV